MQQEDLDVCRETSNISNACECVGNATSSSLNGVVCAKVDSLSTVTVNGTAQYDGLYVITPTVGRCRLTPG